MHPLYPKSYTRPWYDFWNPKKSKHLFLLFSIPFQNDFATKAELAKWFTNLFYLFYHFSLWWNYFVMEFCELLTSFFNLFFIFYFSTIFLIIIIITDRPSSYQISSNSRRSSAISQIKKRTASESSISTICKLLLLCFCQLAFIITLYNQS